MTLLVYNSFEVINRSLTKKQDSFGHITWVLFSLTLDLLSIAISFSICKSWIPLGKKQE